METKQFSDRLELLIKSLNLNANSFAEAIKMPATSIYNYTGARGSKPSFEFFEKLIDKFPQVNLNALIGNTSLSLVTSDVVSEPREDYSLKLVRVGKQVKIPIVAMRSVPAIMKGIEANEHIDVIDVMELPEWMVSSEYQPGHYLAVQFRGVAMHPNIYDGNVVVFKNIERSKWMDFKNNHVHLVYSELYGTQIKYLRRTERSHRIIMLDGENPEDISIRMDIDEIQYMMEMKVNQGFKIISTRKQTAERISALETSYREIMFELDAIKRKLKEDETK